jgi:hypothetical protein
VALIAPGAMAIRIAQGTHPSAEVQLMLLAISTRERCTSRTDLVAALADEVQVDELAAYVLQQRLSIVVPARLDDLGLNHLAGAVRNRVRARRDQVQAEATIQTVITHGLLRSLEEQGIPAIALKGVILSERIYGDTASRESRDIDVLVAPDRLEDAVAIAREEFLYAAPRDALAADGRPLLHYSLSHPSGGPGLELHWRVHWYEAESGAAMLQRSSVADATRRMRPADEFASLLLFYARDGFAGLRNLAALTAWWDRYGGALPQSGLAEFAEEFPQLAPALSTSVRVAAQLGGLPPALQIGGSRSSRRTTRAARLATPQPSDAARWQADVALVDLLLAPAFDLRSFVRRQMLLDTSYLNTVSAGANWRTRWERRARLERIVWRAARLLLRLAARPAPRIGELGPPGSSPPQ